MATVTKGFDALSTRVPENKKNYKNGRLASLASSPLIRVAILGTLRYNAIMG